MDSISASSHLNPVSGIFLKNAARVAQTQVATIKDSKDLKTRDDSKETKDQDDMVSISHAGEKTIKEKTDSASQSGVMSELVKREKKEKTGETTMFGEKTRSYSGGRETEAGSPKTSGRTEEISLEDKLEALTIMNRDPDEIRGDVPQAFFDTAKKMVEGQIDKTGKPAEGLRALKEVETGALLLKPLSSINIMSIHDSNNKPMSMSMEANV
jgi:hypothetical protein